MNAVEIEQAVSSLVEEPFDPATFPYAFLKSFGNPDTTIDRLRQGTTNHSDVGGVLQRNNIHILPAQPGRTSHALAKLKGSAASRSHGVRYILATDGETLEAEDLTTGQEVAGSSPVAPIIEKRREER